MVFATGYTLREAQLSALEELKRLNGTTIGGVTIGINIEALEEFLKETKPPCDCLKCCILRNFN